MEHFVRYDEEKGIKIHLKNNIQPTDDLVDALHLTPVSKWEYLLFKYLFFVWKWVKYGFG